MMRSSFALPVVFRALSQRIASVAGSCSLAFLLAPLPLNAQLTWDGGGASDLVSNADNWNPAGAPPNDGTADLVFDGNVRTSPDFDAAWDLNSLGFAVGADSFLLGGSSLTLGGSTGFLADTKLTVDSAASQSIDNAIDLSSSQTWTSTNGGNLLLGGALNLAGFDLGLDFGSGALQLTNGGSISSAGDPTVHLRSGTLELLGAHDDGATATAINRVADNIHLNMTGGNLRLVADDNSGIAAVSISETIGSVIVNDTSRISVVSSANHDPAKGATLKINDFSFGDPASGTPFLRTFVEGQGNRLDLGYTVVEAGQKVEVSTANGGVLGAALVVREGGAIDFVKDASGAFGTLDGTLDLSGSADFDSSGGAHTFAITQTLSLRDTASISMAVGASGSTRVDVGDDLRLNGTLALTEDASSPLTGSGLHTLFTYGDDLTNNGLELAGGPDFSGSPDWRFALNTSTPGEVNLVTSEVRDWDGGGADGKFSTAANWDADKALATLDHLVFDPAANATIDNDFAAGSVFGGLELGGTNNADLTLTGNHANLSSGVTVHGGNQTFDLDLSPNVLDFDSTSIRVNGGTATFNGDVTMLPGLNLKMELADSTSVTFNGNISGAKLFKTGTTDGASQSTVTLTGVGSFDGAAGGSSITQGDLVLAGANGALALTGNPQLDLKGLPGARARLVLDNSTHANTDRLSDNSLVAMFGNSSVKLTGNATTGVTERAYALGLFDGVTSLEIDAPAGVESGLVFDTWSVNNLRTKSNYLAVTDTSGALGTGGANPFIKFDAGIADGTLVGRASYNGTDLLAYDSANGLKAATTTTTTVGAGSSDHVRLDSNESLAAPLSVESLALNGAKLDGTGPLTVTSGMLLTTTGSELAVDTNAVGSSGLTILDTRGDTTVSSTLTTASTLEKWGDGNLTIAASGQIVLSGSSLLIQQGTVTTGSNNAISATGFHPPSVSVLNGSTLDLGAHDQDVRTLSLNHGSQVAGSGTLTVDSIYAGSIPQFGTVGGAAQISPDLVINNNFQEATGSAGVVVGGNTSFLSHNVALRPTTSIEFQGTVAFADTADISSNTPGASLSFGDAVTAPVLSVSGSDGYRGTLNFDGTLATSSLSINADAAAAVQFNDTVTFSPSADVTNLIAQVYQGEATLGGANGALSGMDELNIGYSAGVAGPVRQSSGVILDNSSSANGNRIDDGALVTIEAGSRLGLIGNSTSNVTEVLGTVNLNAGETTLAIHNDPAAQTTLQVTTLNRTADNVLLVDSSGGTLGAGANSPNLLIDSASAGFLNQAILNGDSFAAYNGTSGVQSATTTASITGASASDHVSLVGNETVAGSTSIQSLAVGGGAGVSGADLTLSTGHVLLQNGASVSNNISTPGDAFIYNNGAASLAGNVSVTGDARKAGGGTLTLGSASGSLSVGAGNTFFIDDGTVATGAAGAIANGTNVTLRQADLDLDHHLSLGEVTLQSGSNLIGPGSLEATNLTIDNTSNFSGDSESIVTTTIDATITGATNLVTTGGTTYLNSSSTYTGTTTVNGSLGLGGKYGNGPGAILNSSMIVIGQNPPDMERSHLDLGRIDTNRIGDSTSIDLHNRSEISFEDRSVPTQEIVGDVTVFDGANARLTTGKFSQASLSMNSFTSTNGITELSKGNNDNFLAASVTIDGSAITDGAIVPTVFRNDGPVAWVGGVFQAVTPLVWNTTSPSPPLSNFVVVNSAFDLAADANVSYIRFDSTDPFNSTPGTTLFVQSGLFFAAENGNTMNAKVSLGANGSISTSSIVRFTEVLEAADDLKVFGGGTTIIDNAANVTGLTSVRDGKLVIGGANSSTVFTGDITVGNGSVIGGSGQITGALTIQEGATTQPGNSPGTLTVMGDLTYEAGSFAEFELGSIGASDFIDVSGTLAFDGDTTLTLVGLAGLNTGTYSLYGYDVAMTGFGNLSIDEETGLGSNIGFEAMLVDNAANNSIDLQIVSLGAAVIPETSTTLLAVLALSGLTLRRRRP